MLVQTTRRPVFWASLFAFFLTYLIAPTLDLGVANLNLGLVSIITIFILFIISRALGNKTIKNKISLISVIILCLFLGVYSHMLFVLHGGDRSTSYLSNYLKIILYISVGYCFINLTSKSWSSFPDFVEKIVFLIVFVAFFNSVVIQLQFFSPDFRVISNSIFIMGDSNINFLIDETRYKGIANGGGASLSVFMGLAAIFSLLFFIEKKLSLIPFSVIFFTIASSLIYVGRTGILIILLGSLLVFFRAMMASKSRGKSLVLVAFLIGLSYAALLIALEFLPKYFIERYFFFLSGASGLRDEGTLQILWNMVSLPGDVKEFFLGIGSATGSFIANESADIGYLKSFTMFGIPLALSVYGIIFFMAKRSSDAMGSSKIFMLIMIVVLATVELKEPFLFKGPSARMFYFLIGAFFALRPLKARA